MPDTSEPQIDLIEFLDEGTPLPPERKRVASPRALKLNGNGFNWTKEELADAVRVGLDRLYLGSTELDEHMPVGKRLHQIAKRVKREQRLIDEAEYEAMKARYR